MSSILFESKHLVIHHHIDAHYLMVTWRGFIPSEQFRSLACEIIKAVEKTKTTKVLSDNREWKIISPNDYSWAANHWFPKAEESGITHMATVLSNDYFNRHAERAVEGMTDVSSLLVKHFEHLQEAINWLTTSLKTSTSSFASH